MEGKEQEQRNPAAITREALGATSAIVFFQKEKGGPIFAAVAGLAGTELVGVLEIGKKTLMDQVIFGNAIVTSGPNGA